MERPSEPPGSALVGFHVGSYLIEAVIGIGGMGIVYRGVQTQIGKRVAIKFLADAYSHRVDLVERFFQEARAVNLIGHENIVDVFDVGRTPEGRSYFVMELLDGPTLEQRIAADRALSPRRTVLIARRIASALEAAHRQGIIHRDLKPDNVVLLKREGKDDFVKLLDFGVAKLTSGDFRKSGHTHAGMVLGTPGHMAPEQAAGGLVDARADVYGLGVLLYQMLAGTMPFTGPTPAAILHRQLFETPRPLQSLRADVTAGLDGLILQMLERDPGARPQTMIEVGARLQRIAERDALRTSQVWYIGPQRDPNEPLPITGPRWKVEPDAVAAGASGPAEASAGSGVPVDPQRLVTTDRMTRPARSRLSDRVSNGVPIRVIDRPSERVADPPRRPPWLLMLSVTLGLSTAGLLVALRAEPPHVQLPSVRITAPGTPARIEPPIHIPPAASPPPPPPAPPLAAPLVTAPASALALDAPSKRTPPHRSHQHDSKHHKPRHPLRH